jgi:hypothetical protein
VATAAAATAGVAYWYLAGRKGTGSKPSRRSAASVQLAERIKVVESKLGRISRLKDSLERMDVRDRIDRVEAKIHRAGRHVRARETRRPLWMVQLADLIGGRWSNA